MQAVLKTQYTIKTTEDETREYYKIVGQQRPLNWMLLLTTVTATIKDVINIC